MAKINQSQAEAYLRFAHRLADAAGEVTLAHFRTGLDVENKQAGGFDPVTLADKGAEAAMRALIAEAYPEHGVYGEEHGRAGGKGELTWVVDPIDGTRSFIIGSPLWGTLIALSDEKGPILGILDQPFLGERFWGITTAQYRGAGYNRGAEAKVLKTRDCASLEAAMLAATTPEMFEDAGELDAFNALSSRARLTRFGGDCYSYGLLAYGFLDLVAEAGLKPYDIHALIPIIEGAGGIVTTWAGEPATEGGRVLAAGDTRAHEAALEVLQAALV